MPDRDLPRRGARNVRVRAHVGALCARTGARGAGTLPRRGARRCCRGRCGYADANANATAAIYTCADVAVRCTYLDWAVREAQRLHAPVTSTMRICARETDAIPLAPGASVGGRASVAVHRGDIISAYFVYFVFRFFVSGGVLESCACVWGRPCARASGAPECPTALQQLRSGVPLRMLSAHALRSGQHHLSRAISTLLVVKPSISSDALKFLCGS